MKSHPEHTPAYVEFVVRVHADGRRERYATVHAVSPDGSPVRVTGPLSGQTAAFARDAVRTFLDEQRPPEGDKHRRVAIDPRAGRGFYRGRRA